MADPFPRRCTVARDCVFRPRAGCRGCPLTKSFPNRKTYLAPRLHHPPRSVRPCALKLPPLPGCCARDPRLPGSQARVSKKPKSAPSRLRRSGFRCPLTRALYSQGEAFPLALPRIFAGQEFPMIGYHHGTGRHADDRGREYPAGLGFIAGAFVVKRFSSASRCPRTRGHAFPRRIDHARDRRPCAGFSGAMTAGSGRR